jgi:hypothetical protein
MTRPSKFHPFAGLKRLVVTLPGNLGRNAQAALDRISEGVERLHTAFQPQAGEDLNSPAYAQRITTEIIYQLSRLDAEAKLQCSELSSKNDLHPGQLEIAVYGLSGIREQLDAITDRYESALALAKAQRTSLAVGGPQVGAPPVKPEQVEAHLHPPTLVDYNEQPRAGGMMSRIFAPRPLPKGNTGLVRRLIAIYTEFSKNTDELERAFHTAQARSLEQLGVAMDELRGSAKWLHDREVTFYS